MLFGNNIENIAIKRKQKKIPKFQIQNTKCPSCLLLLVVVVGVLPAKTQKSDKADRKCNLIGIVPQQNKTHAISLKLK
jgi:predicted Na+-dependent transporter